MRYRGWTRPGPVPPGNIEAGEGETLDLICGNFRIFQYAKGHRYSTDDVLTAWYGTLCAPRVDRAADLGSGIGSIATIVAWRLPGATLETIEAQEQSVRLARKSMEFNGIASRVTVRHGDLRDFASEHRFDLVTGSPPYWPRGTATEAEHAQAVPARVEVRGNVADYAAAAARILAPGGVFVFVFPHLQLDRAISALRDVDLELVRRRDIIFKEGDPPLVSLFAASRTVDIPPTYDAWLEPPLTIRTRTGATDAEYSAIRLSFGFPPGNVPA
ncbi:MAG TPA: methyltransferase [Thermoanaerobaculia bacterium]|nr:methyltransferase [Thermoanaerobaculia bacterium]